ncbi:MAG: TolC family protein [Candidatus Omnitrophota bacterium]
MKHDVFRSSVSMRVIMVIILIGLVCVTATLDAQTKESYTLEDAIRLVLKNNPAIQEATDAQAVASARVAQTRSGLYPQVRAEATYNRIGPAPSLTIPELGTFQLFPHDNYDIHVAGRYMLYDFRRIHEAVRLSETQAETVQDRLSTITRDLTYQTVQLFYMILFLQENIGVQHRYTQLLNEHLAMTRKKVESGTATELDTLTTQVRVVNSQTRELDLQNTMDNQKVALRQLMGLRPESDVSFTLNGDFRIDPSDRCIPDETRQIDEALAKRVEMQAIRTALKAAQTQVTLAGLSNKPAVGLNVMVGVKDGYVPNLNKPFLNFAAGIHIEAPVFDGYHSQYVKQEAAANIKVVEDRQKETESGIRSEVSQAVNDVRANAKKLELVEMNIRQSAKALEFARVKYKAGTATNLDLLDAEEAVSEAELVRVQVLSRYVLSCYALKRAVGKKFND